MENGVVTHSASPGKPDLCVVGIGASTGGLEAIQAIFDRIPMNTGMAIVIDQHLSPNIKSMMDELLKKHTQNGVQILKEIKKIMPNLPIYIVTAFHKEFFNDLQKARSDGYEFELLQKPLASEQLIEVVEGILNTN